jgi:hypothetical protein
MPKELRILYLERLKEIRNVVVADIKLTTEDTLLIKGQ